MPTLFDRWLGRSAMSRNEALIALKLDEIARVEKQQSSDRLDIQARIDAIDTKVNELKRQRRRIETEMATADKLNATRMEQLTAELAELRANEAALNQPDVITAAEGRTLTIKTGGDHETHQL